MSDFFEDFSQNFSLQTNHLYIFSKIKKNFSISSSVCKNIVSLTKKIYAMKYFFLLLVLPFLFWITAYSVNNLNLNNMTPPDDYKELWKEVDAFYAKGQPKSALEIV